MSWHAYVQERRFMDKINGKNIRPRAKENKLIPE